MEFGLDKCAKATFIRGRLTIRSTMEIKLNEDTSIRELDQDETYKYLGIEKGDGIQHTCSHLQFQYYQLELRRNKAKGQKDTKFIGLE